MTQRILMTRTDGLGTRFMLEFDDDHGPTDQIGKLLAERGEGFRVNPLAAILILGKGIRLVKIPPETECEHS